jgi:hypothetical protein
VPTGGPVSSRYQKALDDARASGYAIGKAGVLRMEAQLRRAMSDLMDAAVSDAADDPVSSQRAASMYLQTSQLLQRLQADFTATVDSTRTTTLARVAELHHDAAAELYAQFHVPTISLQARFDVVPVRAIAAMAARPEGAVSHASLLKYHLVDDALPALDAVIGAGVATGASARRLAESIRAVIENGSMDPAVGGFGLDPHQVQGLGTIKSDARRIAVSETNNSLREGNSQALIASGIVIAAKWQRSGRHPSVASTPDECDYLALADLFGYGPGQFPPESWPHAPHPHCACCQGGPVIYRDAENWDLAKTTSRSRSLDPQDHDQLPFMAGLSDKRRASLIQTVDRVVPREPQARNTAEAERRRLEVLERERRAQDALRRQQEEAGRAQAAARAQLAADAERERTAITAAANDPVQPTFHASADGPQAAGFRADVRDAVHTIPAGVQQVLQSQGATIHGANTIVDLIPELADLQPRGWADGSTWKEVAGVHQGSTRRAVTGRGTISRYSGTFVRDDRTAGITWHEAGHAFDDAYHRHRLTKTGADFALYNVPRTCLTGEWQAAHDKGLARLAKEAAAAARDKSTAGPQRRADIAAIQGRLSYYTQAGEAGRSEAFAEIFAGIVGGRGGSTEQVADELRRYFPENVKLAQGYVRAVETPADKKARLAAERKARAEQKRLQDEADRQARTQGDA